ncbi:MAG: aquaporin [Anaerolineae bacterium]|nr:aquaporin [Anaerolineae bacterium]
MRSVKAQLRKYIAEGIGTFALIFCGCGAIVVNDLYGGVVGHMGISLVFGLVVMTMIYAVGNVSGAHFNPAVTLGFAFARRLPWREVVPYLASQLAAAFAATGLLKVLFPAHETLGATLPAGGMLQTLLMEIVLTFILMFVILNVSTGYREKGTMAGVAVGGTVALAALFGGPVSGASMNPARSIAPAVISGSSEAWWLYVIGPVLGALLASPMCRFVQGKEICKGEKENDG